MKGISLFFCSRFEWDVPRVCFTQSSIFPILRNKRRRQNDCPSLTVFIYWPLDVILPVSSVINKNLEMIALTPVFYFFGPLMHQRSRAHNKRGARLYQPFPWKRRPWKCSCLWNSASYFKAQKRVTALHFAGQKSCSKRLISFWKNVWTHLFLYSSSHPLISFLKAFLPHQNLHCHCKLPKLSSFSSLWVSLTLPVISLSASFPGPCRPL